MCPSNKSKTPFAPIARSTEDEIDHIVHSSMFRMKQRELRLVDKYRKRKQSRLISVIMPTWNRSCVLRRAIDSVLSQSYQGFELIISDDGSTDETDAMIHREYGSNARLSYIRNEHRGVGCARNSALEKANGNLIAYLDSDNQWESNYLMIMVNALEDNPGKVCAYCGIRVINEIRRAKLTRLIQYNRCSLLERNYIDMNVFIHTRDLYERYGGFHHDLEPLEDWELILRYTRNNAPLVVECCLANYYISKQLTHQSLVCDIGSSYQKIRERYRDSSEN